MSTVNGLPAHVLLVHAVVVLVPLAALLTVLNAVWPAARRRLAGPTAVLAVAAAVLVPVTTEAGEWLERRVARTPLLEVHTRLGDTLLPWAVGLALVAVAVAVRHWSAARRAAPERAAVPAVAGRAGSDQVATDPTGLERVAPDRADHDRDAAPAGSRWVGALLVAVALVVAAGSVVTVYRIGESGAQAVWTGNFSDS